MDNRTSVTNVAENGSLQNRGNVTPGVICPTAEAMRAFSALRIHTTAPDRVLVNLPCSGAGAGASHAWEWCRAGAAGVNRMRGPARSTAGLTSPGFGSAESLTHAVEWFLTENFAAEFDLVATSRAQSAGCLWGLVREASSGVWNNQQFTLSPSLLAVRSWLKAFYDRPMWSVSYCGALPNTLIQGYYCTEIRSWVGSHFEGNCKALLWYQIQGLKLHIESIITTKVEHIKCKMINLWMLVVHKVLGVKKWV